MSPTGLTMFNSELIIIALLLILVLFVWNSNRETNEALDELNERVAQLTTGIQRLLASRGEDK